MSKLTKDEIYHAIDIIDSKIKPEDLFHYYGVKFHVNKNREANMPCIDIGHNDNNPSLNFNLDKKRYNCLSCEASGNWYSFVTNAEQKFNDRKLPVTEKLRIGAEIANVTLEGIFHKSIFDEDEITVDFNNADESPTKQLEVFSDDVLKQFYRQTSTYFIDRGYSRETLKYFEMGFGIKGRSKDRCVFPVRNIKGELLGWSGRSVVRNPQIKWLHEPEGRFMKGLTLFNIDKALPHIMETGKVYLYESIGNVARAHECNIFNAVATLGNKLTKEQADMLADIADEVVVCGDPDAGGLEMNLLAIKLLYGRVDLSIAFTDFGYGDDGKPLDYGDVGQKEFDSIEYLSIDEYSDRMEEVFIKMLDTNFEKDYKVKLPNGKVILCTNDLKNSYNGYQLTPSDIGFFKTIENSFGVRRIVIV